MKMMLPRHPRAIDAGDRSMSTLHDAIHIRPSRSPHLRVVSIVQEAKRPVLTTHDDRSSVPPPSHLLQHFEMMPETLTSCCEQHLSLSCEVHMHNTTSTRQRSPQPCPQALRIEASTAGTETTKNVLTATREEARRDTGIAVDQRNEWRGGYGGGRTRISTPQLASCRRVERPRLTNRAVVRPLLSKYLRTTHELYAADHDIDTSLDVSMQFPLQLHQ
ncbi:hypothetical protein Hypma_012621 [Hypsizygus marmoreus]|uniref:Uncharacterized protein n=1 Tax=Hypsizygus marmoreus TaxID=39966 RepID=A0A369JI39_HYPMA|nr:hypothetical protein Hypma_012621 [Hypsizygus marmoreus]